MFIHNIDPVLLRIGALEIRYYGLVYILGFVLSYFIIRWLAKERHLKLKSEDVIDYLTYLAIGTIVGARIFYCFVYNPFYYFPKPLEVFFIWQGGMSFHGGLIGAFIGGTLFCKKYKQNMFEIADITMIPLALALVFGRIANFINGELVGRVTDVPWCVKFKDYGGCRHPSQFYEAFKNLIIFTTLMIIRNKKFRKGTLFGIFVVMYSVLRFSIGFWRAPDSQLGYLFLGLTMGQILNILLFVAGVLWLYFINKNPNKK